MALGSTPVREYAEPPTVWFSRARVRIALVVVAVVAFYVVSWHLAKVDLGRLATGLPKMA